MKTKFIFGFFIRTKISSSLTNEFRQIIAKNLTDCPLFKMEIKVN